MRQWKWWLAVAALTLTISCAPAVPVEAPRAVVAQAEVETYPLVIDGVRGCADVTGVDLERCPGNTADLWCVRSVQGAPTVPAGRTVCGGLKIVGGQCRPSGKQTRFLCAATVPVATPTPADSLGPCTRREPGWCWTDGRFFGDECFSSCACGKKAPGTTCVGPSWGPSPKPTLTPTPRPSSAPTASPSPAVDPLAPCRDKRPGWCWTNGVFAGEDCFSRCECSRRNSNTVCVGPGTATPSPAPTASPTPRPTATAKPSPTASPGIVCPPGQHVELVPMCVADAAPTRTPQPTLSPRPTASPRPAATATPPAAVSRALDGIWFVPECTRVSDTGARERWYDWPRVYAAYGVGWNKHVKDFGSPCVGTREIWNGNVSIPSFWEKPDEANIEHARPLIQPVIAALKERKAMIDQMRAAGTPEAQLPQMPVLWVSETASTNYGFWVDSGAGFYTVKDGKRVLRPANELPRVLPKYQEWMIAEYKKAGATEFADAPYVFFWAADAFAKMDTPPAMRAGAERLDYRGRSLVAHAQRPQTFSGAGSAATKAQLTKNNPALWPAGYPWRLNPDNIPGTYVNLDAPDAQAAKRDATYYLLYLYAMKGQYPEYTHIITQITNCGYNKPSDSPWWDVPKLVQQFNAVMGYPPEIQIEGCQAKTNVSAGRAWNAPYAECRAWQSIKAYNGGIVSIWLPKVTDTIELDRAYKSCPVTAAVSANTLTAAAVAAEAGVPIGQVPQR